MTRTTRFTDIFRRNAFGLSIGVLAALMGVTPLAGMLEESMGLDLLFVLRGQQTPPAQVVTVAIDRESASALKAPDDPALWPREWHVQALHQLKSAGADLVVFNVFFGAKRDAQDVLLAEAIAESGNVLLASFLRLKHVQGDAYLESLEPPAPTLAQAALGHEPFLLAQGSEPIRFIPWHGERYEAPTLPVLALFHYLRLDSSMSPSPAELVARPGASEAVLTGAAAGWRAITADRGPQYFNHYGRAGVIPRLSYFRLVKADASELPDLRGKIVVIGYAEDFQPEASLQLSPYSAVSTLELAATAVANLLENRPVRPLLGAWGQAVWLVAWGWLLGQLARRVRISLCVGAIVLSSLIYLAGAELVFALWGYWLPLVLPLFWLGPMSLLGCLVGNYVRRVREHRQFQTAIRRFIPVDVASRLIHPEGQQDWAGRLCFGVCLACDAGQYTALAEKTEPMALGELMNAYYAALFPAIINHGGWVSDVVGDALMAIWVGEEDDPELRRNALRSALAMQEAVDAFEKARGVRLPLRIGLHSGPMRVGFVGASEHGEYRAVGDTVNTAARLEGLNKLLGTRILASDTLLSGCTACVTRFLGSFLLAGKTQPVPVHELLSTSDHPESQQQQYIREHFDTALQLFQQGHWQASLALFEELAKLNPEYGPVRFYRETALQRLQAPVGGPAEGIIRTDKPAPAQHKEI